MPNLLRTVQLALKSLMLHKLRSGLTMLGIVFGVFSVIAMLAMRLCEEYGKTPGPVLVRDADRGWSTLQAAYFAVPESKFENALRFTGQATNYGYITGNTVVTYDAWQPETAYVLRAFVINNANRYELVTAGTSASSGGPTGTDSEITDGTCVWCWRGVTAA